MCVPLPVLAGNLTSETWLAAPPIARGRAQGIDYAASADVCFGHLTLSESGQDLAEVAESAYRRLLRLQQALDFPYLLRIWHCLEDINAGEGDAERYKRFCLGRARALDSHPPAAGRLPAATVAGGDRPGLHMYFLLTRLPPTAIENPRQVSAYRYPRQYGPRRPAFARAARIDWPSGLRHLFVSGTASIVGHETRHPGDAAAQLDESLANVETLLERAGPEFAAAGLAGLDLLKIYLRDPVYLPTVQRMVTARIGTAPWLCLRADLCRRDLLVEVEAQSSL